jgi:hypothetical protein
MPCELHSPACAASDRSVYDAPNVDGQTGIAPGRYQPEYGNPPSPHLDMIRIAIACGERDLLELRFGAII